MIHNLFRTLEKIVNIQKYPFFRYALYRFFNLLENLNEEKKIVFTDLTKYTTDILNTLSYTQIEERNWSEFQGLGTHQSRQMKQKLRFVDQEANEVAHSLINKVWPDNNILGQTMKHFIVDNAHVIQLYIRDIPTMICALFLFFSLRNKKDKNNILFQLNKKMLTFKKFPKKQVEEREQKVEKVLWGKDGDNGEFLIVTVTGLKKTRGALCKNINVSEIILHLNNENITNDEIDKRLNELGEIASKKSLCKLLKEHLKSQNRYYK